MRVIYSLCPGVKGGLEDSLATDAGILNPVGSSWLRAGEGKAKCYDTDGEELGVGNHSVKGCVGRIGCGEEISIGTEERKTKGPVGPSLA